MKEIHIRGHSVGTAQQFLAERPRAFDTIAILDPAWTLAESVINLSREIFQVVFHDIHRPTRGQKLPDLSSVKKALKWVEGRDKLLIACHAGISRSSALAYVLACTDRSPQEALELIDPDLHHPNERVVWLGSKVLNQPEVWETFVAWKGGNQASEQAAMQDYCDDDD
jgi:predicted protein tyrosine phosphatase